MASMKDEISLHQASLDVEATDKAAIESDVANKEAAEAAKTAAAAQTKILAAKIAKTGPFATIADDKTFVSVWEASGAGVKVTKYPTAENVAVPADTASVADVPVVESPKEEPEELHAKAHHKKGH